MEIVKGAAFIGTIYLLYFHVAVYLRMKIQKSFSFGSSGTSDEYDWSIGALAIFLILKVMLILGIMAS